MNWNPKKIIVGKNKESLCFEVHSWLGAMFNFRGGLFVGSRQWRQNKLEGFQNVNFRIWQLGLQAKGIHIDYKPIRAWQFFVTPFVIVEMRPFQKGSWWRPNLADEKVTESQLWITWGMEFWGQPRSSSGGAQVRINAQVLGQAGFWTKGSLHGGRLWASERCYWSSIFMNTYKWLNIWILMIYCTDVTYTINDLQIRIKPARKYHWMFGCNTWTNIINYIVYNIYRYDTLFIYVYYRIVGFYDSNPSTSLVYFMCSLCKLRRLFAQCSRHGPSVQDHGADTKRWWCPQWIQKETSGRVLDICIYNYII